MTIDVWPDLDWSKAIRTPRTVLLEQSEILKAKSKGALYLSVTTSSLSERGSASEGSFLHDASIYSKPLSYYLSLLTVQHPIANPYPAIIVEAGGKTEVRVESEEQFVIELRELLTRPKWIQAIDRLIAMGNSR